MFPSDSRPDGPVHPPGRRFTAEYRGFCRHTKPPGTSKWHLTFNLSTHKVTKPLWLQQKDYLLFCLPVCVCSRCLHTYTHTDLHTFLTSGFYHSVSRTISHTYLHLSPFDVHLNFNPSRAPAEPCLASLLFEKGRKFAGVTFKSRAAWLSSHPSAGLFFFSTPQWWNQTET